MLYSPQFFAIHELVPRKVYEERGEAAWELLDASALKTLDQLRKKFGPMTVNNWYWGGNREWSGLRTEDSPYGSQYSQHRFGRAFDCIFRDATAEEVRQYVLANPDEFPYLTSLELGTSWFHFDTRHCKRIKTFYP